MDGRRAAGDVPGLRRVNPTDSDLLASTLDEALDAILRVRISLGGVSSWDAPEDAIDEALRADEHYRAAQSGFEASIAQLRDAIGHEHLDLVLGVEECANDVVARATEVAWRLGVGGSEGPKGRPQNGASSSPVVSE